MGNTCSQETSPIGKPRMLSIDDDHDDNDTKIMMIILLLMKMLLLMMIMMMYFRYPESKPCSWTAQA